MVRKKIDNRIRVLIENGVNIGHRSMFFIVGDKSRDQVVILHHMLTKSAVKARPSVLWLYKKDLGFSSHRKKRMRELQKKMQAGLIDKDEDNPFEMFISSTDIRYCYYHDTHKILGNTYGMCVIQDFEALTPNLLARTIETVEGGGLVVVLLQNMDSMKKLYTMAMDVHARYRTESHRDVICRFNERFILSLATCTTCMCIDDKLNILPLTSSVLNIESIPPKSMDDPLSETEQKLVDLKKSFEDTQPIGVIVNCCKTLDQGKAVLKFIDAISEKTLRCTVALTAARGRGKSAALGLAMASAVAFGYSNIFVTSPSPENLKTLFDFVFKGFDALEYEEHIDYELVQSTNPEFNKAIIRVNIFKEHRQTIQYIHPSDSHKLGQAELVCIDEAAAIPLPLVRNLLGPYLVFMSSTINGYEGTGRSLSLKLIQQLREQSATFSGKAVDIKKQGDQTTTSGSRILHEISLKESIRYSDGDPVESWLNDLLCLDASTVPHLSSGCPVPSECQLYYVNRDTLFSYHKASETFLQRLMALYVSSHYKNSPNDLQMLSDAPQHHIFCLLGPVQPDSNVLPQILCCVQVCLEGEISKATILNSLSRGKRASGDLVPWTMSQQFQDSDFPSLSGARIVRIATHPDYQRMGYGKRAIQLIGDYYKGRIIDLSESSEETSTNVESVAEEDVSLLTERLTVRKNLPPLLLKLNERPPEKLDYLSVSYGLTADLLRFWKKSGFVPTYLRQTPNDLTGEHSCIMLCLLHGKASDDDEDDVERDVKQSSWLDAYWKDFRRRFVSLLSFQFRAFTSSLALELVQLKGSQKSELSRTELNVYMTPYDMKRLELYSQNMADYHLIMDLLPHIAKLFFTDKVDLKLSIVQKAILIGLGLQHKSVDDLEKELGLPGQQILGLFNRLIRKMVQYINAIEESAIDNEMKQEKELKMTPVLQTLDEDLEEGHQQATEEQRLRHAELMSDPELKQYAIKGSNDQWKAALGDGKKNIVSIKGKASDSQKRPSDDMENGTHKRYKGGEKGGAKKKFGKPGHGGPKVFGKAKGRGGKKFGKKK